MKTTYESQSIPNVHEEVTSEIAVLLYLCSRHDFEVLHKINAAEFDDRPAEEWSTQRGNVELRSRNDRKPRYGHHR
jgi:hypothetical protein